MLPRSTTWLFTCILAWLSSCNANYYSKFYDGIPDARALPGYEANASELQIRSTTDFEGDRLELMRQGYMPIGQAFFNAPSNGASEASLRRQADRVGAHLVLIASSYSHTVSGYMPITTPTTTTSYSSATATAYGSGGTVNAYGTGTTTTYGSRTMMVPYSVPRSDFGAMFFARYKTRFGLIPGPVSDETRRALQTNGGVTVVAVQYDSPAFEADILPGDIVLFLGEDRVQSVEQWRMLLDKHQGTSVTVKLARDGQAIEKQVHIEAFVSPTQGANAPAR